MGRRRRGSAKLSPATEPMIPATRQDTPKPRRAWQFRGVGPKPQELGGALLEPPYLGVLL